MIALALASLLGGAPQACAQANPVPRTFVLVITGVGGEPKYVEQYYQIGARMVDAATHRLGVPDSLVTFLTEEPQRDATHRARASTKTEIARAFGELPPRMREGDQLFVLLVGHGSGERADSRFNVMGPDPSASDFATWLKPLGSHPVVFVNATSASGDWTPVVAGPNRVVITATKSAMERNETMFAPFFVAAFAADGADADKDGRVSVLEAFHYAKAEVERAYTSDNRLQTEHPQLDDSTRARHTFLGGRQVVLAANDPKLASLYGERDAIQTKIDALRARKAQMDSTAYEKALEPLLVQLATTSQEIRQAEAKKP